MNKFLSKILLFGEYSIIFNSKALTVPYRVFSGELCFPSASFDPVKSKDSNSEIKTFVRYLKSLCNTDSEDGKIIDEVLNIDDLAFDVNQGLFFNSTIPQGYGLGSSGALCACILGKYLNKNYSQSLNIKNRLITRGNLTHLKKIFQIMESHFHGSSSGVDPLISYLGVPLMINENGDIDQVDLTPYETMSGSGALFLLNTKRARRTEPLVNLFLEKCKSEEFSSKLKNELSEYNNLAISQFLNGKFTEMGESFRKISEFQYEHFEPMIPKLFRPHWKSGLDNEDFYLKLCGAGGGGFLIGFASNIKKARQNLEGLDLKIIWNIGQD